MKPDSQKNRIQLIVAIGLAVLAAVFLIVGGIIGYQKWNDLKENEEQKKQEEELQETEEEQEEVWETDEAEEEQEKQDTEEADTEEADTAEEEEESKEKESKENEEPEEVEKVSESEEQEITNKEQEILSEAAQRELYYPIIEKYIIGMTEQWNGSMYAEAGLCYMCRYYSSLDEIGYIFMDVDENGILELLIGETNSQGGSIGMFFDMYTIVDNEVVLLATSGERDRYYICTTHEIANEASGGAALSSYSYYSMSQDGTSLVLNGIYIADSAADEENPWFYSTSEDWEPRSPISEDVAIEAIYCRRYMDITYTPLSEYEAQAASEVNSETTGEEEAAKEKTAEEVYQLLLEHYAEDVEAGATFFEGEVTDGHYEMSARCAVPGNPDGASQALYFIDVDMSTGEVIEKNQIFMETTVYQLFEVE